VLEDTLLAVLRDHADRLAWAEGSDGQWAVGRDGQWAKVKLEDARRDMHLVALDSPQRSFDSALKVLKTKDLYREIDSASGWVDMGEQPQPDP
jgi:hypothetical protein